MYICLLIHIFTDADYDYLSNNWHGVIKKLNNTIIIKDTQIKQVYTFIYIIYIIYIYIYIYIYIHIHLLIVVN